MTTPVWNVLFVMQGKETAVKDRLESAALRDYREYIHEVLLPLAPIDDDPHKKNVKFTPIYPGYIFLKLEKKDGLINTILGLENVIKFLGASPESPSVLRDHEVKQIKSMVSGGKKSSISKYRLDEMVEITGGHCKKLSGRVSRILEQQDMLEVEIQLFGRAITTKVKAEDVKKA